MKQSRLAAEQFGATAQAYLSSAVHAQGADLARIGALARDLLAKQPKGVSMRALDLGCGAGHVAFTLAAAGTNTEKAAPIQVTACDLSAQMLDVVGQEAARRHLANVTTRQSPAETLPFGDGEFDVVATRFSAHHWGSVPAALREVRRVLKPGGTFVVIDAVAPEAPLLDTLLQSAEILRDASHVRDYKVSEWQGMLREAGFDVENMNSDDTWVLRMEFDVWVARMRTSAVRAAAIRDLLALAPEEAQSHFNIAQDGSFDLDVAWIQAQPRAAS